MTEPYPHARAETTPDAPDAPVYRTVLFDCDGTLLDTLDDLAGAGNAVCALNGWPSFTPDEYRHLVGNGQRVLVRRITPPALRDDPATLSRAYDQFCDVYARHGLDTTRPYPGIVETVGTLAANGVRLGVLTNKNADAAARLVRRFFGDLLPVVQGRTDDMPAKPDPAMTSALMARLGADPASTLMVGDSDVDIACGVNAGIASCGVLWGFRDRRELEDAGATHIAATTRDLVRIVLGR